MSEFQKSIVDNINNNEFSITLLEECKNYFHMCATNDEEKNIFTNMMIQKVQEYFPDASFEFANIFAKICLAQGCHEIRDIIFIDGAAFGKYKDFFDRKSALAYMEYIGSTNDFRYCDTSYLVYGFTSSTNDIYKVRSLAKFLSYVFNKYYNVDCFPESLHWQDLEDGCTFIRFALDCSEQELINAILENKPLTFKIASRVDGTNKCRVVEIEFAPEKENQFTVTKVDDQAVKLSKMIREKENAMRRTLKLEN